MEADYGDFAATARQFERSKVEAVSLAGSLTEQQFNWRPAPGRWSVGQCLVHLSAIEEVVQAIDRAIQQARSSGWHSSGPFRYGWFTRMVIRSMEPPPRWRMRTFPVLTPPPEPLARDEVLRTFAASRDRLLERVAAARGLDVRRAIVVSPFSRLVRIPLGGYLAFLAAHDRRHLWQARQVRESSGFGVQMKD